MKTVLRSFLFLILTNSFSCEEQGFHWEKCSDCTKEEPAYPSLNIKVDLVSNTFPVIEIYEGNLEDSVLYDSFSAASTNVIRPVGLNKKYTITATYYIDGVCYIAIDAATPRVRLEKNVCEDPCYIVYDNDIDLRLKYTK